MNDPARYVRDIEAYLCQKNGGHLIRVVGPAFELVRGWASAGVPLKVALRGIDRCCQRRQARAGRRRPIRIEFCEADVLDAFDEWRRAVGVATQTADHGSGPPGEPAPARKPALAAHIDRAIARLAHLRGVGSASTPLHHEIDRVIRALEEIVPTAARVRGEARAAIASELARLDGALLDTAVADLDGPRVATLRAEAADELAPFGTRMPADARARAREAAFRRLVREAAGLPTLTYE